PLWADETISGSRETRARTMSRTFSSCARSATELPPNFITIMGPPPWAGADTFDPRSPCVPGSASSRAARRARAERAGRPGRPVEARLRAVENAGPGVARCALPVGRPVALAPKGRANRVPAWLADGRRGPRARDPARAGVCLAAMLGQKAVLQAATAYLRSHPDELMRMLRNALGLRFGLPIDGLRWLAGRGGEGGPKDVRIEAEPPCIKIGATVLLMGTTVRANTTLFVERIRASAEELRLEIRLEGTDLQVLGDADSPV